MPLIVKDLESPCQPRVMVAERRENSRMERKKSKGVENWRTSDLNMVSREVHIKPNSVFEKVMREEDDYLRQKEIKVTTLTYP